MSLMCKIFDGYVHAGVRRKSHWSGRFAYSPRSTGHACTADDGDLAMGAAAHPSDLLPGRPGQVVRWIGKHISGSTPRIRFPPAWGFPPPSLLSSLRFFHTKKINSETFKVPIRGSL